MALDLTPRFRRLNSQTRSFRENLQNGFSGPFGATQLWHNIIHALHSQIEVRRCRRHLRLHSDCFTGSDAVDTVLSYLMQNVAFYASEVSRLKAARLCQALMEAKVFEPIGMKLFHRDKEASFEDSSWSLYRFLEYKTSSVPVFTDVDDDPTGQEMRKRKSSRLRELRTISNPLAVGPSDRRVERLLRTINLQPSWTSALNATTTTITTTCSLSKAEVADVWKQQTLLLLLQIVEVPMLDSILTSPGRAPPQTRRAPLTNHDLIISNTFLERELPDALSQTQLDAWLSAAADCLELLPDQLLVVAEEQLRQTNENAEQMSSQKRLLFDTIAKHYSSQERAPLLSGRYLDIHVAILNLLDEGKVSDAIKASQLCLRLLETSVRDELWRLLTFMAAAAQTNACRLQKQTDNRTLVCRTFQKALVQNQEEVNRSQSETLVLFLTDNHSELFKTPTTLIEAVRRTLRSMQQGKDPDNVASFTFCQQVTPQEYEDRREASTLENLKELLSSISSNPRLPAKEKKKLLKEFEKHHPVVFLQHLSSTA